MSNKLTKLLSLFLSFCLILEQGVFAQTIDLSHYFAQSLGKAIPQSDKFRPLHLRYIFYDNQANDFKILLDKGDYKKGLSPQGTVPDQRLKEETQTLMKYFFIGLALPNEKFWVNLRPDSPDNILDPDLEKTDIGRIFLEADLQLKKDTASWTSPQNPEGKAYWDKLYKKAEDLFGTENITIPTLTRPWIVPNEIIIREAPDNAYIYKATLKVMLEEDYLRSPSHQVTKSPGSLESNPNFQPLTSNYSFSDPRLKELNEYSTQLIKETIIPKLTYEVNTSKRFAPLRQVYYSLILAQWFKQKYGPGSPVSGLRSEENPYIKLIDSGKLTLNSADNNSSLITSHSSLLAQQPYDKQSYFRQYQKSFQDGEYSLQEPVYTPMGQSVRRYMSGGIHITGNTVSSAINEGRIPTQLALPYYIHPDYILLVNARGDMLINPDLTQMQNQKAANFSFLPGISVLDTQKVEENIGKIIDFAIKKNNESGFWMDAKGGVGDIVYGIRKRVNILRSAVVIHYHPLIEETVAGSFALPSPQDTIGIDISIVIWGTESLGFFATMLDVNKIGRDKFHDLWRKNLKYAVEGCKETESIKYYRIDRNDNNRFVDISYDKANEVIQGFEKYYWGKLNNITEDAFKEFSSKKLEEIRRRIHYLESLIDRIRKKVVEEKIEAQYGGGRDTDPLREFILRAMYELKGVLKAEESVVGQQQKIGLQPPSASSAVEKINQARGFFKSMGLPIDESGLVSRNLSDGQIKILKEWNDGTRDGFIYMPNEDTVYKKVYLAVSLGRQIGSDGSINYLFGKGIGVEIALQGEVKGRKKRQHFPMRPHADFELYGMKDIYSAELKFFDSVFGSQERYPLDATKGLKELPGTFILDTSETVDLGGLFLKIPSLELLFAEKIFLGNSEAEIIGGRGYDDIELLAKTYSLDREKIDEYLQKYGILLALNIRNKWYGMTKINLSQENIKQDSISYERPFLQEQITGRLGGAREYEADAIKILSLALQDKNNNAEILKIINNVQEKEIAKIRDGLPKRVKEFFDKIDMDLALNGLQKNINSSKSSSSIVEKYSDVQTVDKGGVDFAALPIRTQAMPGVSSPLTFSLKPLTSAQLDAEWARIQQVFNSGIRPSIQRLSEYTSAAAASSLAEGKIDQVRVMLADILRRDEESQRPAPAEESCKQLLRLLELG